VNRYGRQATNVTVAFVKCATNSIRAEVVVRNVHALAASNIAVISGTFNIIVAKVVVCVVVASKFSTVVVGAVNKVIAPLITRCVDAILVLVAPVVCAFVTIIAKVVVDFVRASFGVRAGVQSTEDVVVTEIIFRVPDATAILASNGRCANIPSASETIVAVDVVRNVGAFANGFVASVVCAVNFIVTQLILSSVDAISSRRVAGINGASNFVSAVLLDVVAVTITSANVLSASIGIIAQGVVWAVCATT